MLFKIRIFCVCVFFSRYLSEFVVAMHFVKCFSFCFSFFFLYLVFCVWKFLTCTLYTYSFFVDIFWDFFKFFLFVCFTCVSVMNRCSWCRFCSHLSECLSPFFLFFCFGTSFFFLSLCLLSHWIQNTHHCIYESNLFLLLLLVLYSVVWRKAVWYVVCYYLLLLFSITFSSVYLICLSIQWPDHLFIRAPVHKINDNNK